MTQKLDEILVNLANQIAANEQRLLNGNATREETIDSDSNATMRAEQAITSLTKELVAEAKPEKQFDLGQVVYVEDTGGKRAVGRWVKDQQQFQIKNGTGSDYMDGYNAAIDQFEQNLLKALEKL